MGTRHRSAYRLCTRFPEALAVVISQDGGVRFVGWHEGAITYWDHTPLGSEEAAELYTVYSDGSGVEAYCCDHGRSRIYRFTFGRGIRPRRVRCPDH